MRRRSLLAAGMLSVLLTTSACSAVTPPNSPARSSGPADAGFEASSSAGYDLSSDEIGATQRAAAAAAAQKADAAIGLRATAEAAAAGQVPVAAPAAATPSAAAPAPAAAASAAALKQALKPSKTAPGQPASASELIVGATGKTAHPWHANTPAGPAEGRPAESGPVGHQDSGDTATDEDPAPNGVGHSGAPGEDARQAGTRISFPDARRSVTDKDTCDNCKDRNDSPCHRGGKEDGASHSD